MPMLMSGGDFLASEELCAAGDRPVIVLVTPDLAQPERIERKFAACWTGYDEAVLIAPWDRPILYRYATACGGAGPAAPGRTLTQIRSRVSARNPTSLVTDSRAACRGFRARGPAWDRPRPGRGVGSRR